MVIMMLVQFWLEFGHRVPSSFILRMQVKVYDLQHEHGADDVLVMGTDGLWDVLSNQEVAEAVTTFLANCDPDDLHRSVAPWSFLRCRCRFVMSILSWRFCDSDHLFQCLWQLTPNQRVTCISSFAVGSSVIQVYNGSAGSGHASAWHAAGQRLEDHQWASGLRRWHLSVHHTADVRQPPALRTSQEPGWFKYTKGAFAFKPTGLICPLSVSFVPLAHFSFFPRQRMFL